MTQKQSEIPGSEPKEIKEYFREHECKPTPKQKKQRRGNMWMRQGIDPRYYVGYCSTCNERVVEMPAFAMKKV